MVIELSRPTDHPFPAAFFPSEAGQERRAAVAAVQRSLDDVCVLLTRAQCADSWNSWAQRVFLEAVADLHLAVRGIQLQVAEAAEQEAASETPIPW